LRLIKLGLVTADNVNDEVGLLRFDPICNFQVGDFEKGREQYKKALGIFAKYTSMNSYYVETTHFLTEKNWALSEFYSRQCSYVDVHVAEAKHHLSAFSPGSSTDQFKGQLSQMQQTIKSCVP
jgi:hypothetical protein